MNDCDIKNLEDKLAPKPETKKPKTVKLSPAYVENDLRLMINRKGGTYKVIKNEGVIINISEYL